MSRCMGVPTCASKNSAMCRLKNCEGSYMALKVGSAAAWSIPTDGAKTALSGSLFHTGSVLMKNEYLYASIEANITCFLHYLLHPHNKLQLEFCIKSIQKFTHC